MTLVAFTTSFTLHAALAQQTIDVADIVGEHTDPATSPYPRGIWTLEHWLNAVIRLSGLIGAPYAREAGTYLRLVQGHRWNLVPLLTLNGAMCDCSIYGRRLFASTTNTTTLLAEDETQNAKNPSLADTDSAQGRLLATAKSPHAKFDLGERAEGFTIDHVGQR
ncbi:hypothetical protein LTR17_018548, partial [Elasticomyces elasticus]